MATTIAHISDLHFGRVDHSAAEALLADIAQVQPTLVVISGDLVQRPGHGHFSDARDFIARLAAPYLVVPGNHDIPVYNLIRRFTVPFHRYQSYISEDLNPFHVTDDQSLAVLGINTARSLVLNFAHGRINHKQIAYIREAFEQVPKTAFKVVVTHHPFVPHPDGTRQGLLGRAKLALPALVASGVDLLLSGHLHRSFSGDASDHHRYLEGSILIGQAATATSTRLRDEPNGYTLITVDSPLVTFQPRVWLGDGFQPAGVDRYRRREHRWDTEPV